MRRIFRKTSFDHTVSKRSLADARVGPGPMSLGDAGAGIMGGLAGLGLGAIGDEGEERMLSSLVSFSFLRLLEWDIVLALFEL